MENASKALLIVGGMLIGILLFSLFIYMVRKSGAETAKVYTIFSQSEIAEFNQKFYNYEDKDLTIQDVVSIVNLAKDNNQRQDRPTNITVSVNGTLWNNRSDAELEKAIIDNLSNTYLIPPNGINTDTNTMLVNSVRIRTKSP